MGRPNAMLTPEESARLKGQEWEVPAGTEAITIKEKGVEREVYRWSEVAQVTEATIDETDEGVIKGRISVVISDEDHHRNSNPRQRLTVWLNIDPEMAKLKAMPQKGDEEWGKYWGTSFGIKYLESFLKAVGQATLLVNRKHLTNFGAVYDFLAQTDLSGREVLVSLQYPPRQSDRQVEPDLRYFEVVS